MSYPYFDLNRGSPLTLDVPVSRVSMEIGFESLDIHK